MPRSWRERETLCGELLCETLETHAAKIEGINSPDAQLDGSMKFSKTDTDILFVQYWASRGGNSNQDTRYNVIKIMTLMVYYSRAIIIAENVTESNLLGFLAIRAQFPTDDHG